MIPHRTRTLALCLVSVAVVSGCSHCQPGAPPAADSPSPDAPAALADAADLPTPPPEAAPPTEPASCRAASLAAATPTARIGHSTTRVGDAPITIGGYAQRPEERCIVDTVLSGTTALARPDTGAPGEAGPGERWGHTATVLGDGILVVGGSLDDPELSPPRIAATALFREGWRASPQPTSARAWHSAAAWRGGVVIAGGRTGDVSTASVERFDAAWTRLPDLPAPVFAAAVAATPTALLVAGGSQGHGCGPDCAKDCYADEDCRGPALCNLMSFCEAGQSQGWTYGGDGWVRVRGLRTGAGATATALGDGSFLVAGGYLDGAALGDVWRVREGRATRVATLQPRFHHTASLLHDGRVAFVGGQTTVPCSEDDCDRPVRQSLATAQVLDPATGSLRDGPRLGHARSRHTATVLVDGGVQLLGGWGVDRALVPPETHRF